MQATSSISSLHKITAGFKVAWKGLRLWQSKIKRHGHIARSSSPGHRPSQSLFLLSLAVCNSESLNLQAVHMSQKAMTDLDASEGDVICAPKLLEVILQNCRGRVDQLVPHFISLALGRRAHHCIQPDNNALPASDTCKILSGQL